MNSKRILPLLIVLFVIAGAIYFASEPIKKPATNTPSATPSVQNEQITIEEKVLYGGLKPDETMTANIKPGQTALDLLMQTKKAEVKEYSFGKSVESIEGVKSGTDGKYWLYYVNGAQSQVGADQYQLKANDKVEWRLEKGS